jgi:hypothetical protein
MRSDNNGVEGGGCCKTNVAVEMMMVVR